MLWARGTCGEQFMMNACYSASFLISTEVDVLCSSGWWKSMEHKSACQKKLISTNKTSPILMHFYPCRETNLFVEDWGIIYLSWYSISSSIYKLYILVYPPPLKFLEA